MEAMSDLRGHTYVNTSAYDDARQQNGDHIASVGAARDDATTTLLPLLPKDVASQAHRTYSECIAQGQSYQVNGDQITIHCKSSTHFQDTY